MNLNIYYSVNKNNLLNTLKSPLFKVFRSWNKLFYFHTATNLSVDPQCPGLEVQGVSSNIFLRGFFDFTGGKIMKEFWVGNNCELCGFFLRNTESKIEKT